MVFRSISFGAEANKDIYYSVLNEIKNNETFNPETTKDTGTIGDVEEPGTFTFKIIVGLKHPLKL